MDLMNDESNRKSAKVL
ncbi:hypothetical protein ABFA07_008427 [Porites harrisoni]